MKGAIAAGHPLTAEAGAQILAAGGNAVDACIAAAFTSWVCESPLTGPGGGGFMLVHDARDGKTRLLDFFVAVPGTATAAAPVQKCCCVSPSKSTTSSSSSPAACAAAGTETKKSSSRVFPSRAS
ncbi:MAG TPA: gamma-glutamyltransferase, partial [Gaiellaceae bacterium]|nr:gamma-glutamyltransferase [Gaiellaceae bacterium]